MRTALSGPVHTAAADAGPCVDGAVVGGCRAAVLDVVRSIAAGCGVRESTSPDDAGFFCEVEGAHEIAVRYNAGGAAGASAGVARRAAETALLGCCPAFVDRGLTVTVVMSPRTLVLFLTSTPHPA